MKEPERRADEGARGMARETSRATATVTAERRERAESRLWGRAAVTGPRYPSAKPNMKPDHRYRTRARRGWSRRRARSRQAFTGERGPTGSEPPPPPPPAN